MIKEFKNLSIFDSGTEAIVNPVNCVGVMGAGLAKAFKDRYPLMFLEYKKACNTHSFNPLKPGSLFIYNHGELKIICFPTKNHFSENSKIEYIDSGLISLSRAIKRLNIKSISIPMLGCGLGGLKQEDVIPLFYKHLSNVDCEIKLLK